MKTKTTFKKTWPTVAVIAAMCTASTTFGQTFSTSGLKGSSTGGVDGASCGASLTQSTNPDSVVAGSVACSAGGINTDNFYARNFPVGAINVLCVDFGVETCTVNPWPITVNLYSSPNAGVPVTANLTLLGTSTVMVPAGTTLAKVTASFGAGVAVPAGNLVVEVFTPCRQTTCAGPPAGDGGAFFIGSNAAGQSAPSYIKSAPCGLNDYGDLAGIGFPNMHLVMEIGSGAPPNPCTLPLPFCPEDLVGNLQSDPPNGVVGTPDLLKVINGWGQNGQPNGPRPDADIRPLDIPNSIYGDCLVSTLDLLGIINKWGPCPEITGACCADDGSCTEETEVDCLAAGGTYEGDNTLCANVVCPVVPANDDCDGAPSLGIGAHAIDNTGATDGSFNDAACTFGGAGNFNADIWYTHTAVCDGNLTIDLCATTSSVTDTVLAVYTGTCPALTIAACDDDACTNNPAGDRSRIIMPVSAGTTYYIRVGTWGANPPGPMTLTIGPCTAFNNDLCSDATALSIPGTSGTQNINGATVDVAPACNGIAMTNARWYTVIGNGNTLTASLCTSPGGQLWDARLSVYCGANCNALFCVVGQNADNCNGAFETVSFCTLAGQKYYIAVHTADDASGEGDYVLTIADGAICNNPALCGEPGDECESALTAVLGANNGDNTNMTLSAGNPDCATMGKDQWWNFTPASTGLYTFSLCGGTAFDSAVQIVSGSCGAVTQVACDDDGCGTVGALSVATANLTAGTQYKVRVGTWNNTAGGAYVLTISTAAGCGACTGTSEGLPCRVDGDVANTDPNGGCNSTGLPPGTPFGGPIAVDEVVCGTGSYYTNSTGGGSRDTDWFLFTPGVSSQYSIVACADFPISVFFVSNGTTNVTTCGTLTILGAGAFPAFTEGTSPAVALTAGTTYVVFAAPQTGLGTLPCGNYRIKVIDNGPPPPPPANDGCAAAVTVAHTSTTAGTVVNATPLAGPDGELVGQPYACHWAAPTVNTIHNTVWYKFVATATTAQIDTCGSAGALVDTIVGVFSGTCGSLTQIGCGEDECAAGAAPYWSDTGTIVGLTIGQTYFICVGQPGGWAGEVAGAFNLTVSP